MSTEADVFHYARRVEAVLFAAAEPLRPEDIRGHAGEGDLGAALALLMADYGTRGIQLVERGGQYLFQTAPDCADALEALRQEPRRLGKAALETLAIIAWNEPVTRAEIESVRGVAMSRGTLDLLMAAGWVRTGPRREAPGRPLQYLTTPAFLAHFGLASRRDLPGIAELKAAGLLGAEPPEAGREGDGSALASPHGEA